METRDKFVMSVAFSPDSKWLASGGLDGLVNIFDVQVGVVLPCLGVALHCFVLLLALPWVSIGLAFLVLSLPCLVLTCLALPCLALP